VELLFLRGTPRLPSFGFLKMLRRREAPRQFIGNLKKNLATLYRWLTTTALMALPGHRVNFLSSTSLLLYCRNLLLRSGKFSNQKTFSLIGRSLSGSINVGYFWMPDKLESSTRIPVLRWILETPPMVVQLSYVNWKEVYGHRLLTKSGVQTLVASLRGEKL